MSNNTKFVQKPGTFSMFLNSKKERDTQPDYGGTYVDDQGREYWVNCWVKQTQAGVDYFSGTLRLKEGGPGGGSGAAAQARPMNRPSGPPPAKGAPARQPAPTGQRRQYQQPQGDPNLDPNAQDDPPY